jgi:hypothetical protein
MFSVDMPATNLKRDLRRLGRYTLFAQIGSFVLGGLGLVCVSLYTDSALAGTPADQIESYIGNPIWLALGLMFATFGTLFLLVAGKRRRRLLWIFNNATARAMNLAIEVEDSFDPTTYYALLGSDDGRFDWKMMLYSPSRDTGLLGPERNDSKVYFDPDNDKPAVVESAHGFLWGMAGSAAAQRLE